MPFTFSHPAIVLPLTYLPQRWYSLTGLIIGSITPDFEYFIRMKIRSDYSHTIPGIFWFDLPLGILLAFLFHNLVRKSLFENLPLFLKSRLAKFEKFDWYEHFRSNWPIVIICLLLGSASHLLWDSFTHNDGYFVKRIPFLIESTYLFNSPIASYRILQHLSTLVGGLIILMAVLNIPRDHSFSFRIKLKYWVIVFLIMTSIVVVRLLTGLDINAYGDLIVTIISASLIGLILAPLILSPSQSQSIS